MVDHNRVEGSARKIGGDIKEAAGKALGDGKLEAEGKADKIKGKAQNALGGVKDALRGKDRRS
ncbi:MAG: CsbD family protein [Proteobacteria bacterium]|nr:CsbD family protein [Pseudomonadota bacterium]